MNPQELRGFAARHWSEAAALKRDYWAHRFRTEGWQPVWTAAQGLLSYARHARRDFPSADDRERDRRDHAALRARLDRAAHAFARR